MSLTTELDYETEQVNAYAQSAAHAVVQQGSWDGARSELQGLASEFSQARRLLQRNLEVPIRPADLKRLRTFVLAVGDAMEREFLDQSTDAGQLVASLVETARGIALGPLQDVIDEAGALADEISAIIPATSHYFDRKVQSHRVERTSDVAAAEAEAITEPQLKVKRSVLEFLKKIGEALMTAGG